MLGKRETENVGAVSPGHEIEIVGIVWKEHGFEACTAGVADWSGRETSMKVCIIG